MSEHNHMEQKRISLRENDLKAKFKAKKNERERRSVEQGDQWQSSFGMLSPGWNMAVTEKYAHLFFMQQ